MHNFKRTTSNKYNFHNREDYVFKSPKGLSSELVELISHRKKESEWMRNRRLEAYKIFVNKPVPLWGGNLAGLDFQDIHYYLKPTNQKVHSWNDLPSDIRKTYEKIGVPNAEKKFLAGVSAQYESEVVYENIQKELQKKGVVFLDMDSGLARYPEVVQKFFGTLVPPQDNKFAALNSAVWSGGTFIYIPKNVHVEMPLQAYFRMNAKNLGQFERTLIIADEGSFVHYIEGCTAPVFTSNSLHAAVVEIFVKKGARVRYSTVQNWSKNVYNLVTKRMLVEEEGIGEWIDCNLGSKLTMKYPAIYLKGRKSRGEILSVAYAGKSQHQDAGGKIIHMASNTSSIINSKSVSQYGGRTSFRGLVHVAPHLKQVKMKVACHALLLDDKSRTDTYPTFRIKSRDAQLEHEASVSKISEEQLFYLRNRGIDKATAESLVVNGFIEPIVKELPLEYSVEMNRLIKLQMEESVS